jgi:ATP-dependent helicase/nuclease subunit B
MDPFVAQLHEICRQFPTRAKWVFVPTHALGRTLGDRLVLEGRDWANLRFVTPVDVAVRMAAPFLVERGIDPSEEGLGPALIMQLLLARTEGDGYFRPLASQPPLAQALWATIRELRLAGVSAGDVAAAWPTTANAARGRELAALLDDYETYLAQRNRGDLATVFHEAARHLDWCPIAPQDCWTELPDVAWPVLQRRLIDMMPGERIVPEAFALPGAPLPRRLAEARVRRLAPDASAPLAFLLAPGAVSSHPKTTRSSAPPHRVSKPVAAAAAQPSLFDALDIEHESIAPEPASPGPRLDLFHAGGREAEVEEVFRRIVQSGCRLDDVEIVCAAEGYSTLVWEKALRYDWPITMAGGIPAILTRPGRAVIALVEWIEDDFSAGLLRKLLQSGDVALTAPAPSPAQAARLLVKARAAWGRDTYRLALARLAKASRTRATRDDVPAEERDRLLRRADDADALGVWIAALLDAIPVPASDGRLSLQALVESGTRFLQEYAARANALDHVAAAALGGALAELLVLSSFRCTIDQGLRFLRERVEGVIVGADRPRPGHLHVSSLVRAGYAGRNRVFVLGLEEGRVFPSSFEDPILLDDERGAICPTLALSADRVDEAVFTAVARLAAISAQGGLLTLSYSSRDVREFRQTYASWLLLQAFRIATHNPAASYRDLHRHLGPAASCVPGDDDTAILSPSRWWLRGLARSGCDGRDAVLSCYPALAAGEQASAARRSEQFTEYDGFVPAAGATLDPCAGDRLVSPTQLEDAAECPFRHFLRRGLRVDAIETGERERDTWLDPLIRGSLLHDLYAEFLRRCRREQRRVRLPDDRDWLLAQGREALRTLAREMPPPSIEIEARESRALLDDLAIFAAAEAALEDGRTPVGLEVPFGRDDGGDQPGEPAEPLGSTDPVTIELGDGLTFRLAGRIDRIDRVAPSTFEIIDYKTGGYWPQDWEGTFAGGRRLQHALYGLAAAALLRRHDDRARVAGASYYFSSAKGQQTRKVLAAPSPEVVSAVLRDVRAVIASGLFVHATDDSACKWCDFGHACGRDARGLASLKMADPRLEPNRRLAAHE